MASQWTDDQIDQLKSLWQQGLSASKIADQLSWCTRNAVIGKVHRLGLATRSTVQRRRSWRPKKISRKGKGKCTDWRAFNGKKPAPVPNGVPKSAYQRYLDNANGNQPAGSVQDVARKSFADLEDHDCRWPCGDPQDADFGFCGSRKVPGISYCAEHAGRAFDMSKPKRPNIFVPRAKPARALSGHAARRLVGA